MLQCLKARVSAFNISRNALIVMPVRLTVEGMSLKEMFGLDATRFTGYQKEKELEYFSLELRSRNCGPHTSLHGIMRRSVTRQK